MIRYEEINSELMEMIKALYKQHGWLAYLQDDGKLKRALEQSLYMLGAFEGDKIVGFIRCVGDGEHIVLVQDLIVAHDYLRKGIGRELMRRIFDRFSHVRMLMLNTDELDERANAFYQAIGMNRMQEMGCVSYMK